MIDACFQNSEVEWFIITYEGFKLNVFLKIELLLIKDEES
jgi:hypothetical protein